MSKTLTAVEYFNTIPDDVIMEAKVWHLMEEYAQHVTSTQTKEEPFETPYLNEAIQALKQVKRISGLNAIGQTKLKEYESIKQRLNNS